MSMFRCRPVSMLHRSRSYRDISAIHRDIFGNELIVLFVLFCRLRCRLRIAREYIKNAFNLFDISYVFSSHVLILKETFEDIFLSIYQISYQKTNVRFLKLLH